MQTKKLCTCCKQEKLFEDFNKNKSKKDGLNNICRECSNKRSKKYYLDNKEAHKKNVFSNNTSVRHENRLKYYNLLKEGKCIKCGFDEPAALVFDHRDDVDKIAGVGRMVSLGYKWETIIAEIEKCDLLCANCHAIRTSKQQDWYYWIK